MNKLTVFAVALLFAITVPLIAEGQGSEAQDAARQRLAERSLAAVDITTDARTGIPSFVTMLLPSRGKADPASNAIAYFEEFKDLYNMANPAVELRLRRTDRDELGYSHVRLTQVVNGVPVFGSEVIAHFNRQGQLYAVNGSYVPGVDEIRTDAGLSGETAIAIAIADVGEATFRWETALEDMLPEGSSWKPEAELMLYSNSTGTYLAYRTMIAVEEQEPANWVYFIDANTGGVIDRYNDLKHTGVTGTGNSLYRGTVSIGTNSAGSSFELKDMARNVWTYDGGRKTRLPGNLFTDSDNIWGDGTTSNSQSAAVDAHWGIAQTYDYYLSSFGRNSLDGAGMRITATVHYKQNYVNAFWNGQQIVFGDGDGVQAGPLVDLDVVAHELTHGVTEHSANLIYSYQSGALNESFSDVFAMMVDVGDFWIGEDSWTPGTPNDALRYMDNPTLGGQPKHMNNYVVTSYDNGGVHTNSGIPNFAAYLATAGGVGQTSVPVAGIGRAKVGAIWYRALTMYMTPSTDFAGARAATIAAAGDLYGASDVQSVTDAWTAVGVLQSAPPTTPPPTSWTGAQVAYSYSTPHPYRNRKTYTHTISHSGATGMKVDFANFSTEAGYDFVEIKDGTGATIQTYNGNLGTFTSAAVSGSSITVKLTTDQFINDYGFDITAYWYTDPTHPVAFVDLPGWQRNALTDVAQSERHESVTPLAKEGPGIAALPDAVVLQQNYPNPFNPSTVIRFTLPETQAVQLAVYNSMGQKVKTLVSGSLPGGLQSVIWDGTDESGTRAASGVYVYRLTTATDTQTKSMLLMQ